MFALIRPCNVAIAIAVIAIALLAAEATLNTKASAPAVAAASTASGNRPTSFETNPIIGSDASISTYGLDPERLMDW